MAGKPDYHERAVRAWKTRARNAKGSGTATASRGDFAHQDEQVEVDLSGVDVGSSPRMDQPSPWASPADVERAIEIGSTATREDVAEGLVPLLRYSASMRGMLTGAALLGRYEGGTVTVTDHFLTMDPNGRTGLLPHEFGHEVAARAFSGDSASERTIEVLKPFRKYPNDPFNYDNFAGLSQRPEEFIADVYADLMTSKRKPWEDEGGRYAPVYKHVLAIAKKAGLPKPKWLRGW